MWGLALIRQLVAFASHFAMHNDGDRQVMDDLRRQGSMFSMGDTTKACMEGRGKHNMAAFRIHNVSLEHGGKMW